MAKVVGYVRVSTAEQAERGISLDAQRAKIEAYCALHDLVLVGIEVDAGLSGSTMDRPGLQRALEALRKGAATGLVVLKMDRLTRSVADLSTIIERHFKSGKRTLHSVTESVDTSTAMGRGVLNIFASLGQMEREQIAERTSTAMQHLRSEGRYTGGRARFGYVVGADGALVEEPAEQAVLATVRDLRARGLAMRAIVASLEERGVRSRAGKPFALPQVARMLAA
jgi:DNA invertase Pin-like site-specific DNA recombinase